MTENPAVPVSLPPQPQINPEQLAQQYARFQQNEWDKAVQGSRMVQARERGLSVAFDPSVVLTPAELVAMVPLEGDDIRYAKDADGKPRMATNKYGMFSWPKQRGRRRPHMTKHAQAVKSSAIRIFKGLFAKRIIELEAAAVQSGETFNGIPNDALPAIGARATILASKGIADNRKARRRRMRNESKLQRRINTGVIAGNVNRHAYTIN